MDIKANEIESVETIGELNGEDVKILKTFGGFHMAVGKKKVGKKDPEVLAAGSHPALVSHQLTKEYEDGFKPKICKSEGERLPNVEDVTQKLRKNLTDDGLEAYILEKDGKFDFIISRFGVDVIKYEAEQVGNSLFVKNQYKTAYKLNKAPNGITEDFVNIINDKCKQLNISKVVKSNG
jgi:hypothetical protein